MTFSRIITLPDGATATEYRGLKNDMKPLNASEKDTFVELDTDFGYTFTDGEWVKTGIVGGESDLPFDEVASGNITEFDENNVLTPLGAYERTIPLNIEFSTEITEVDPDDECGLFENIPLGYELIAGTRYKIIVGEETIHSDAYYDEVDVVKLEATTADYGFHFEYVNGNVSGYSYDANNVGDTVSFKIVEAFSFSLINEKWIPNLPFIANLSINEDDKIVADKRGRDAHDAFNDKRPMIIYTPFGVFTSGAKGRSSYETISFTGMEFTDDECIIHFYTCSWRYSQWTLTLQSYNLTTQTALEKQTFTESN